MILLKIIICGKLNDVWNAWNTPENIIEWYQGHQDWSTIEAINNFQIGSSFKYVMNSKDKKSKFTLEGSYLEIIEFKKIRYSLKDKREIETSFQQLCNKVQIIQKVELDARNSTENQAEWWRNILINFKKHIEQ